MRTALQCFIRPRLIAQFREELYSHKPYLFFRIFGAEFVYGILQSVAFALLEVLEYVELTVFVHNLVKEIVNAIFVPE